MTPGRKPSIRISAPAISFSSNSTPRGFFRLTAILRRLRNRGSAGGASPGLAGLRSTRITSAPRSASMTPQMGAGPNPASSITLTPLSGPDAILNTLRSVWRAQLQVRRSELGAHGQWRASKLRRRLGRLARRRLTALLPAGRHPRLLADIVLDTLDLRVAELTELWHPLGHRGAVLQRLLEGVQAQTDGRFAQIRSRAAGLEAKAVAQPAVGDREGLADIRLGGIDGEVRLVEEGSGARPRRRQLGLAVEDKGEHPAGLQTVLPLGLHARGVAHAAPAGDHRQVLAAAGQIGDSLALDTGLGVEGPQLLAAVGGVGVDFTCDLAVEHQATPGGRGAAIEDSGEGHRPHLVLLHRIPGQQLTAGGRHLDGPLGRAQALVDHHVGARLPGAEIPRRVGE